MARLLLQHFGSLNAVFDAELPELSQFHGIGPTKYSQLMAVKELGRRYSSQQLKQEKLELNHSAQLLKFLQYEFSSENQEINQLLRYCIAQHATFVVIAHNHPLGKAQPSAADIELTERILQASQLVDIQLIDHFILSPEGTFSFAEHDLIQPT